MNEKELNHQQLETLDSIKNEPKQGHSLKRIHHSWIFWVFVVLMLAAISYYVLSVDFAFAPQKQLNQPPENNMTP